MADVSAETEIAGTPALPAPATTEPRPSSSAARSSRCVPPAFLAFSSQFLIQPVLPLLVVQRLAATRRWSG